MIRKYEDIEFFLELTQENSHNSLNFLDTGLIFIIFSYLYVCKKSYLATLALGQILKIFFFLIPPSEGGGVKKYELKFYQHFCFLYLGKVKKF